MSVGTPPPVEYRPQFDRDLKALEAQVMEMAVLARRLLDACLDALARNDSARVRDGDRR